MRIEFKGDAAGRLAARLAARLDKLGHRVTARFDRGAKAGAGASSVNLLFALEGLLYGAVDRRPGEAPSPTPSSGGGEPDLVVDFDGEALSDPVDRPTCIPLYDGRAGEEAAVDAILDGRAPRLTVALRMPDDGAAHAVATALPALEERLVLTSSLARVLDHMARLLVQAVERARLGVPSAEQGAVAKAAPAPPPHAWRGAGFLADAFTTKLARRLTRLVSIESHWRIGWRWAQGDDTAKNLAWPAAPYAFVPDDARRYFADPFVLWRDGVAHVFCEEFPYVTGKGVISTFTIARDGAVGTPRVVLERPYHLSYPMVFERDGAAFMIPESSASGAIELYRATRFPDIWELDAVLVEGVSAADATLIERDGMLWLFAAIAEDGASSWDALGLFHAPRLAGPWTPHPANAVLIDAATARPAGLMFARDGALIRPAQDCTSGYGSALTLCRVDRLDPESYAQTLVARLVAQPGWRAEGVHTLNAAGGLEVVDCCGWRSRSR